MKKVYFVRHGESEDNAGNIRQHENTILTDKGRKQATMLAKRFESIQIDLIITSTLERAIETGKIIGDHLNLRTITSDLFVEKRSPSELVGLEKSGDKLKEIEKIMSAGYLTPNSRYSDEENFEDFVKRAIAAKSFIEEKEEENLLIVTHGFFLQVLLSVITFGKDLTGKEFNAMFKLFKTKNTSITWFDIREDGRWKLRTWNDHAHLGEIKD